MSNNLIERQLDLVINLLETLPHRIILEQERVEEEKKQEKLMISEIIRKSNKQV